MDRFLHGQDGADLLCSGCRDEFNDNPDKYMKKLALRMAKGDTMPIAVPSSPAKDDAAEPVTTKAKSKVTTKTKGEPKSDPAKTSDPAAKAASVLATGQALEKSRKRHRRAQLLPPSGQGVPGFRRRQDGSGPN